MRRVLDKLVNALLRMAPWYHPADIRARERRTERVHNYSIASRKFSERVLIELDSYRRVHLHR